MVCRSLMIAATTALLLVIPISGAQWADPRRVVVLYTGDPYPGVTPYLSMKEDAFIVVQPVQASSMHYAGITWDDIRRSMRVYMARTYEEYVDKYDVTILSDSNRMAFTSAQISWFKNSVLDHGMGLLMVGGYESFAGGFGHPSWKASPVEDVLPVEIPTGAITWVSGNVPIAVGDYDNEFIASLPYRPLPEYTRIGTDGNYVIRKQGSDLLAYWVSAKYDDPPCYVTWKIGKGRTYAMCHDWTPGGGWLMSQWDYYRDYSVNLMLYLSGRPLPTDHLVVHQYRRLIHHIAIGKNTLLSLMGFVESFGGNPRPIDEQLIYLDSMVGDAREDYLDHNFDLALSKVQGAFEKLKSIEELSVRIKDEALFWVYMVQWLSVMGVSMFCGVLLWTLMVRRRLFHEVKVTRLQSRFA